MVLTKPLPLRPPRVTAVGFTRHGRREDRRRRDAQDMGPTILLRSEALGFQELAPSAPLMLIKSGTPLKSS